MVMKIIRSLQMSELVSGKHLVHYHVQNKQDHDQNGHDAEATVNSLHACSEL